MPLSQFERVRWFLLATASFAVALCAAAFLGYPTEAKKVAEFGTELKTAGLKRKETADGLDKLGIGAWLRNLPFGARVNDWFFAHAGHTHGRTIKQLQTAFQQDITANGF